MGWLISWTLFSNDYETLIIFYFFPFIFSTKLLFVMGFKSSTDLLLTAAYFLYFLKALTHSLFSSAQYKKEKLVNKIQLVQVRVWKCLFGGTWRRLVNIHLPNTFFWQWYDMLLPLQIAIALPTRPHNTAFTLTHPAQRTEWIVCPPSS